MEPGNKGKAATTPSTEEPGNTPVMTDNVAVPVYYPKEK
jgi:hypothetical protein